MKASPNSFLGCTSKLIYSLKSQRRAFHSSPVLLYPSSTIHWLPSLRLYHVPCSNKDIRWSTLFRDSAHWNTLRCTEWSPSLLAGPAWASFLRYGRLPVGGRWPLSASHVVTTRRILFCLRFRLLLDVDIRDEECEHQWENVRWDANDVDDREGLAAGTRQVIIHGDEREQTHT